MEFRIARARLKLVCFIRFRSSAYGTTIDYERDFIAEKLSKDPQAIKKWEQRLPKSCLGQLEVNRELAFAINAASHVSLERSLKHEGLDVSESVASMAEQHKRGFDSAALEAAVQVLRQLEGWDARKA